MERVERFDLTDRLDMGGERDGSDRPDGYRRCRSVGSPAGGGQGHQHRESGGMVPGDEEASHRYLPKLLLYADIRTYRAGKSGHWRPDVRQMPVIALRAGQIAIDRGRHGRPGPGTEQGGPVFLSPFGAGGVDLGHQAALRGVKSLSRLAQVGLGRLDRPVVPECLCDEGVQPGRAKEMPPVGTWLSGDLIRRVGRSDGRCVRSGFAVCCGVRWRGSLVGGADCAACEARYESNENQSGRA